MILYAMDSKPIGRKLSKFIRSDGFLTSFGINLNNTERSDVGKSCRCKNVLFAHATRMLVSSAEFLNASIGKPSLPGDFPRDICLIIILNSSLVKGVEMLNPSSSEIFGKLHLSRKFLISSIEHVSWFANRVRKYCSADSHMVL